MKKQKVSSGPAKAAAPPPSPSEAAAPVAFVASEDADALDCGVCFLPLKPPIFQCQVGHVVCSPCRAKLSATGNGKCHLCGVAISGYQRCHGMERLVEAIRAACPNAPYGCTARPAYHDRKSHGRSCPHAPYRCPGKDCGFVGSTEPLLNHFSGVHGWPCTKALADGNFKASLHDGFNFLRADHAAGGAPRPLILLNAARLPHGCAIYVVAISQHAAAAATSGDEGSSSTKEAMEFELTYSWYVKSRRSHGGDHKVIEHYQRCKFWVPCTDISSGLPIPDDCFQLVVPNFALGEKNKERIHVEGIIFN